MSSYAGVSQPLTFFKANICIETPKNKNKKNKKKIKITTLPERHAKATSWDGVEYAALQRATETCHRQDRFQPEDV